MVKKRIIEVDIEDLVDIELQAIKYNASRELLPYLRELILELQKISKDVAITEFHDDKKAINNIIRTLFTHEKNTKIIRDCLKRYRNTL